MYLEDRDSRRALGKAIRQAFPKDRRAVVASIMVDAKNREREFIGKKLGTKRRETILLWAQKGRALIRGELPPKEDVV